MATTTRPDRIERAVSIMRAGSILRFNYGDGHTVTSKGLAKEVTL